MQSRGSCPEEWSDHGGERLGTATRHGDVYQPQDSPEPQDSSQWGQSWLLDFFWRTLGHYTSSFFFSSFNGGLFLLSLCRLCPWQHLSTMASIWTNLLLSRLIKLIFVVSSRGLLFVHHTLLRCEPTGAHQIPNFVFSVVTKPSDCIFPYDFRDALRKKVRKLCVVLIRQKLGFYCIESMKMPF